jgi:pilus assembly protein CpaE
VGQLSFVVFSDSEEACTRSRQLLEESGHAEVLETLTAADALVDALRARRPDALYVDLGKAPDAVLRAVEAIAPPRPLLVLAGPQEASALILRAMRLGAREFLPEHPSEADLSAALERLLLGVEPSTPAGCSAPVLAVMGAKGGVGATLVACQLAARLQAHGQRTVLVDLNLPLGDVALHLDVQPRYTLANLANQDEHIDATYLKTVLQTHPSGLEILAAPTRVEEAELVHGRHVERALAILRASYDFVVLDVSRSWTEPSVRALDLADQILLVTLRDVTTLSHAREHLDLLRRLGHPETKIRLIANRASRTDPVTPGDFDQFLGRGADVRLPNDYRAALTSVTEGRSLAEVAPRSPLTRAFDELADKVVEWCHVDSEETEPKRGWLRGLGRRLRKA